MLQLYIVLSIILSLNLKTGVTADVEYYWREYRGEIPSDAFPVGKGLTEEDTYIGQAYVHTHGVFVAQIFPGKEEFTVPAHGEARKIDMNIKILCTKHPDNFKWISTSNTNFLANITNKQPVVGGYDAPDNLAVVYIGRILYQGILKIGQIGSSGNNHFLYFPHKKLELKASQFQVLLYRGLPVYNTFPK